MPMREKALHIDIPGLVIGTTDQAVLLRTLQDEQIWVPRSLIEDGARIDEGDEDLMVEEWWATKEGLI